MGIKDMFENKNNIIEKYKEEYNSNKKLIE
jgi:hypothetical protein